MPGRSGDEVATEIDERKSGSRSSEVSRNERLANGLGWFSIGLGLAEVLAPGAVAHLIGLDDEDRRRAVLRVYGLREITAGIGILSQERPAGWLWGRVAGDAVDLASLGVSLSAKDADRTRVTAAIAAVVGVTVLDAVCAKGLSECSQEGEKAADTSARQLRKTVIINRPPGDVYGFWRNFSNLPTFMRHLESVETFGDRRSRWRAKGPAGKIVEWQAEIVDDQPEARIAWRSLEGSDVDNAGSVEFKRAPGGRGTLVQVGLEYTPPGGAIGAMAAKLFRAEPGQQIEDALRALKQVMETGEIVHSDASIHPGMHAAQPAAANA
jgi:uncharacterized membrane protein